MQVFQFHFSSLDDSKVNCLALYEHQNLTSFSYGPFLSATYCWDTIASSGTHCTGSHFIQTQPSQTGINPKTNWRISLACTWGFPIWLLACLIIRFTVKCCMQKILGSHLIKTLFKSHYHIIINYLKLVVK